MKLETRNVTKVFQMRAARPDEAHAKAQSRKEETAPPAPADLDAAVTNEIYRVTGQKPCAGCS